LRLLHGEKVLLITFTFGENGRKPVKRKTLEDIAFLCYSGPDTPNGRRASRYGKKCVERLIKKGLFKKYPFGKDTYIITEKGMALAEKIAPPTVKLHAKPV